MCRSGKVIVNNSQQKKKKKEKEEDRRNVPCTVPSLFSGIIEVRWRGIAVQIPWALSLNRFFEGVPLDFRSVAEEKLHREKIAPIYLGEKYGLKQRLFLSFPFTLLLLIFFVNCDTYIYIGDTRFRVPVSRLWEAGTTVDEYIYTCFHLSNRHHGGMISFEIFCPESFSETPRDRVRDRDWDRCCVRGCSL